MAETTIPKDWDEVRAAVNLVERGVKVIIIFIISRVITIVITIVTIMISVTQGEEMCSSFQCSRGERHSRRIGSRSNKF